MFISKDSLLRSERPFRLLFSAFAISLIGDWFSLLAIFSLLGGEKSADPFSIALVLVSKLLPGTIVAPFGGYLADRFGAKTIMIASDVLRAILIASLIHPSVASTHGTILFVTTLSAMCGAVFEPARQSLTPSLLPPARLIEANSLLGFLWSGMMVLGSLLGGLVSTYFGVTTALAIDALSFLISAWLIVKIPRQQRPTAENKEARKESLTFKAFFDYIKNNKPIQSLLILKYLYGACGAMYVIQTVNGQEVIPGQEQMGISLIYAARGLGALCGVYTLGRVFKVDLKDLPRAMVTACGIGGVAYFVAAFTHTTLLVLPCIFVSHLCGALIWTSVAVLLQKTTQEEFRGRVFGIENAGFGCATSLSCIVAGTLMSFAGVSALGGYLLVSALFATMTLYAFRAQRLFKLSSVN